MGAPELDAQGHRATVRAAEPHRRRRNQGRSNGDIYTRVCFIDKRVREMSATVTAQAAAIEALSKALGANPADIAATVEKAVKDKLDAWTSP